jgi:protein-S-isoprenylcysteine O-methyltransferase Ste14
MSAGFMSAALLLGWGAFIVAFATRRRAPPPGAVVSKDTRGMTGALIQGAGYVFIWTFRRGAPTPLVADRPWLDPVAAIVVVLLMGGSVWLVMTAIRGLGRQWAVQARTVDDHQLITTGAYALVRHPIYTGMLGLLLGTGLAISQWWALGAGVIVFAIGTAIRVRAEEGLLASAFGAEFEEYRARVPAVLPLGRP